MANAYAIRVHIDRLGDDGVDMWKAFMKTVTNDGYVFVIERDANREHIQGWVRTDVKQQAFRKRMLKAFPGIVGNAGYSLSNVKDFAAYSDYVLKGTEDNVATLLCHQNVEMNEQHLQDAHRRYWSKRDRGSSKGAIVAEVYDWARTHDVVSKRSVVEYTCSTIVARNKPLMVPYVIGVVNSVMYKLSVSERENIVEYITGNIR